MISKNIINFNQLRKTDIPYNFVEKHNGRWNHEDWLAFLEQIKKAGYNPIDLNKVCSLLELLKNEFQTSHLLNKKYK